MADQCVLSKLNSALVNCLIYPLIVHLPLNPSPLHLVFKDLLGIGPSYLSELVPYASGYEDLRSVCDTLLLAELPTFKFLQFEDTKAFRK